jgi:hemolysin III
VVLGALALAGAMMWRRGKLTRDEPNKPLMRGKIHIVGFFLFFLLGTLLIFISKSEITRLCLCIYLLSMLVLFSTSSVFHTTPWRNHIVETLIQKADHASIFLLITGTYTPVCVLLFDLNKAWPVNVLIVTWLIGISGVFKSLLVENPPKIFNVFFYFACGLTVAPFIHKVFESLGLFTALCMASGGAFYLLGGTIYGFEWPDPIPRIYGYHEIFHTLTLVANFCFLLPIMLEVIKGF